MKALTIYMLLFLSVSGCATIIGSATGSKIESSQVKKADQITHTNQQIIIETIDEIRFESIYKGFVLKNNTSGSKQDQDNISEIPFPSLGDSVIIVYKKKGDSKTIQGKFSGVRRIKENYSLLTQEWHSEKSYSIRFNNIQTINIVARNTSIVNPDSKNVYLYYLIDDKISPIALSKLNHLHRRKTKIKKRLRTYGVFIDLGLWIYGIIELSRFGRDFCPLC